jgi:hypothetical protein
MACGPREVMKIPQISARRVFNDLQPIFDPACKVMR